MGIGRSTFYDMPDARARPWYKSASTRMSLTIRTSRLSIVQGDCHESFDLIGFYLR